MPIIYDQPGYTAPTGASLIDRVLGILGGYTMSPSQVTYLTAPMGATDTTVQMAVDSLLSRGVYEVDDELIYVYTAADGSATLLPQGRGWKGTTATTHATGATVTVDPIVPRLRVREALNETITHLWPDLYQVKSTTFTLGMLTQVGWPLPDDAECVLDVRWTDSDGNAQRVRGWEVERTPAVGGVSLRITQAVPFGRTITVVYGTRASTLADLGVLADTGLPESCLDLLVYGALVRLLPVLDVGRINSRSVAVESVGQSNQLGSASALAANFAKQYQSRLDSERTQLRRLYPARIHFTR